MQVISVIIGSEQEEAQIDKLQDAIKSGYKVIKLDVDVLKKTLSYTLNKPEESLERKSS